MDAAGMSIQTYPITNIEQASFWFGLCWAFLVEDEDSRKLVESVDANGDTVYNEPIEAALFDRLPNLKKFVYYNLARLRELREFVADYQPLFYDDVKALYDSIDEALLETDPNYEAQLEADYNQLKIDNLVLGEVMSTSWTSYTPWQIERNTISTYVDIQFLDDEFPEMFLTT